MPRLRKKRRLAPPPKVHDLRHLYGVVPERQTMAIAIEEPGGLFSSDGATLEAAQRKDGTLADGAPEWIPPTRPTIIVFRSIRNDPLGQMWAREQIDYARYLAGRHYQELTALGEIGSVQAMDPGKPIIDGSCPGEVLTDRQHQAAKQIVGLNAKLAERHGQEAVWLTKSVLIERQTVSQAAALAGRCDRKDLEFLRTLFGKCLTELAIVLGYATRAIADQEVIYCSG